MTGSDCLEEIGILTLQHPLVPRKSRIQCLVSHTFSGFCCWNVTIIHPQKAPQACMHTRTWTPIENNRLWVTSAKKLAYPFHIHTLQSIERRVWICEVSVALGKSLSMFPHSFPQSLENDLIHTPFLLLEHIILVFVY